MRGELIVSNAVRRSDGVHVRTVGERRPSADAVQIEPRLEDAFLYVMNFTAPQKLGAAA